MLAVFAELEAKELGRWILRILKRSRDLQEALGVLVRTSPDSSQSAFASAYPIFSTLRRREWLKTKWQLGRPSSLFLADGHEQATQDAPTPHGMRLQLLDEQRSVPSHDS